MYLVSNILLYIYIHEYLDHPLHYYSPNGYCLESGDFKLMSLTIKYLSNIDLSKIYSIYTKTIFLLFYFVLISCKLTFCPKLHKSMDSIIVIISLTVICLPYENRILRVMFWKAKISGALFGSKCWKEYMYIIWYAPNFTFKAVKGNPFIVSEWW